MDKNFELKTYDKYNKEEFNIKAMFLYLNSTMKVQISDHIFIYPFNKKYILFFDADECKAINVIEIKGNEFNMKCDFSIREIIYLKDYLLLLIQLLPNKSLKLLKYSIDEATLNINYTNYLNLGNDKENSISFKRSKVYIIKNDNFQNDKKEKLQIFDIDI